MKSLETLAANPFISPLQKASRANVIFFADETLGRFNADNPGGVYDNEIKKLVESVLNYKSGVTDAQTGERQDATATVDSTQQKVVDTGRSLYSALQTAFGYKASQLMVFFPKGLTALNHLKRGEVDTVISNWLKMASKHPYIDKLGQTWVTDLTALQTTWQKVTGEQSGAKEGVDKGGGTADSYLPVMAQHLWNLLLLVIQTNQPKAENVVGNYFDTTPLNEHHSAGTDGLGRTFGLAKDSVGAGLPAVNVTLKNADQQIIWAGKTDGEGKWRTKSVAVGMYHITFEKPGYISQTLSHEILDNGDTAADVTMLVG